jgi:hypothetical protein
MAHFAKLDNDNKVINVIVGPSNITDAEAEAWVEANLEGRWLRTSYNTYCGVHYNSEGMPDQGIPFRKNYAIIGGFYDEERDAFFRAKPTPEHVISEETWDWILPTP